MSRRDQPYIPLYVMDFLTDEKLRECSAESVGVYIMLMCVMHKQEEYGTISLREKDRKGPDTISDFSAKLAKHLPFGEKVIGRALIELLAEGVLYEDGGRLIQKRMLRDADISEKRATAGKKGSAATNAKFDAAKQAAKYPAKSSGNGVAAPAQKDGAGPDLQTKRFDEFWAAYPKKVGKGEARKSWRKIKPDAELHRKILAAVEEAKRSEQWTREHGQYIPNPATWLNQSRWEDELTQKGVPELGGTENWRNFNSSGGFKEQ